MYKCTQCDQMQDIEGVCQQCGGQTVATNDTNGTDIMSEEQESADESAVSDESSEEKTEETV